MSISASPGLGEWLVNNRVSLAMTSFQSGRLFLVGTRPDGIVSVHQQAFSRAMGVSWDRGGLWLASRIQLWRLENIAVGDLADQGIDLQLMPRRTFITGNIDVHEIACDAEGCPVFVNTSHSCLSTLDSVHSFRVIWKPHFITGIANEDRCHINGLGMLAGRPKYVTAVSQTDTADGWHGRPLPRGVIVDVTSDDVLTDRLAMPHSPRAGPSGDVFALDSGTGYLVRLDRRGGQLHRLAFCPGFLRGLVFVNDYAVVTVSKPRYDTFKDLPIGEELERRKQSPICGLLIIDLSKSEIVEWLRFEGEVRELFTVELIPEIRYPVAVGPSTTEFGETITFADLSGSPDECLMPDCRGRSGFSCQR